MRARPRRMSPARGRAVNSKACAGCGGAAGPEELAAARMRIDAGRVVPARLRRARSTRRFSRCCGAAAASVGRRDRRSDRRHRGMDPQGRAGRRRRRRSGRPALRQWRRLRFAWKARLQPGLPQPGPRTPLRGRHAAGPGPDRALGPSHQESRRECRWRTRHRARRNLSESEPAATGRWLGPLRRCHEQPSSPARREHRGSRVRRRRRRWRPRPGPGGLGPRQSDVQSGWAYAAVVERRRGTFFRCHGQPDAGGPGPILVGARARGRGRRLRPRCAGLLQAVHGQLPVRERRQRPLPRRHGGTPSPISQQLRLRGNGSRRRRTSRSRHDQRRRRLPGAPLPERPAGRIPGRDAGAVADRREPAL